MIPENHRSAVLLQGRMVKLFDESPAFRLHGL
jgi:hypothetical protein